MGYTLIYCCVTRKPGLEDVRHKWCGRVREYNPYKGSQASRANGECFAFALGGSARSACVEAGDEEDVS